MFGASRYGAIVDPIELMFWELTPLGDRPPPAAAPAVDFELLDMAPDDGPIEVTRVSDWVDVKISSLCKLAEVHSPHMVLLHIRVYCRKYTPYRVTWLTLDRLVRA